MDRETRVVVGRLAMKSEQLRIARAGKVGVDVVSVEALAERLAGGFVKVVKTSEVRQAVSAVVQSTDLGELNSIKELPGFPAAAANTLMRVWKSGLDLSDFSGDGRIKAIMSLETAVRAVLPGGRMPPVDIVRTALTRCDKAKAIFGRVSFKGMTELHAVWRDLLFGMHEAGVEILWDCGPAPVPEWLGGRVRLGKRSPFLPAVEAVSCATARHEAMEALRWARKLLSEGVPASDIGIATVSTSDYDDYLHDLARNFEPGLHFAQGVPISRTASGQMCAALADILLRGISQKRIRRLISLVGFHERGPFEKLDPDWGSFLPVTAALSTDVRWERAFGEVEGAEEAAEILMPLVRLLQGGTGIAAEAGEFVFSASAEHVRKAKSVWQRALESGPASSLDSTLSALRDSEEDREHPQSLTQVVYMPAADLAASPRKHVRLIGMSSRAWPRKSSEDALIPDHVIPAADLDPFPLSKVDKSDFLTILAATQKSVSISWPRRDSEGRQLGISSLLDEDVGKLTAPLKAARDEKNLKRLRLHGTPEHAYTESDRLFSRPSEFAKTQHGRVSASCWKSWRSSGLSGHDGLLRADHPAVIAALQNIQSPTSLKRLLRDPQGYVWRYALGFSAPEYEDDPITLDARQFGNITHGILQLAVEALEKHGGLVNATDQNIESEVHHAAASVGMRFEIGQPVPPALIWQSSMENAYRFCVEALKNRFPALPGQKTFVEVPFGSDRVRRTEMPWDTSAHFEIPKTDIKISGVVDRVDLSGDGKQARSIDYKSGRTPSKLSEIGIGGGSELQRSIYGYAIKSLLPDVESVEALLYYPSDLAHAPLANMDEVLEDVAFALMTAKRGLGAGASLPGVDASDRFNDLAFALPANAEANYIERKRELFDERLGLATAVWEKE